jgi:hypothetical protein
MLAPWLSPRWTWKLEYLFVDLGSVDTSTSFAADQTTILNSFQFFSPLAGTMTTHTHFTDNVVRFGLNYHPLCSADAPTRAKLGWRGSGAAEGACA